jgi:hypothetical protein
MAKKALKKKKVTLKTNKKISMPAQLTEKKVVSSVVIPKIAERPPTLESLVPKKRSHPLAGISTEHFARWMAGRFGILSALVLLVIAAAASLNLRSAQAELEVSPDEQAFVNESAHMSPSAPLVDVKDESPRRVVQSVSQSPAAKSPQKSLSAKKKSSPSKKAATSKKSKVSKKKASTKKRVAHK